MYTTTVPCTYMNIEDTDLSNEMYQTELLAVFGLNTYSDSLVNSIQNLYNSLDYPIKDILQHVSFQYSDDSDLLFLVLFSYDYFKYTHDLLCKIITKQDTTQSQEELITVLKK
jgi:hypothetical protein